MKNRFSRLVPLLCLALLPSCLQAQTGDQSQPPNPAQPAGDSIAPLPDSVPVDRVDTLVLMAVGDIMLGSDFPRADRLPPNDDAYALLRDVAPILARGDLVFGNLEGCFGQGGKSRKACKDPSKCYSFRVPVRYAPALQRAGFNLLSLANNHVGDFGLPAQRTTIRLLDSLGIAHAGLLISPVSSFMHRGLRIGLCAFAPNSGTCQLNDMEAMRRIVNQLAAECDVVIASCHMGAEGSRFRRITREREVYLGENRGNPYQIARLLIDAGADVVLGHGPHVTRAIDLYKGRLICYSLGNFCTYGRFNLSGVLGLAPLMEIRMLRDGAFAGAMIHATRQVARGRVERDPSGRVIAEIQRLTCQDFPESPLRIEDDGRVLIRGE